MSKEKRTQDEALAERLKEIMEDQKNETDKNYYIGIANILNRTVIDPAVIAGSVRLLKAHRTALYDSIPIGDIDAMGLLNLIQEHLAQVDASIAGLEQAAKPVEVLDGEAKAKPLDRMEAQEAEVVENEDAKS